MNKRSKHVNRVSCIFDHLDHWRHFPNYQLERRTDIFFALYIPEVLDAYISAPVLPNLLPEFPVRIGTIYPNIKTDKSVKVDYVAISQDGSTAYLIELKTDMGSRRTKQDDYLEVAQSMGFPKLLSGLLEIFRATSAKRKYFSYLKHLESMGQLDIPESVKAIMNRTNIQGITKVSHDIVVASKVEHVQIVYIQPEGELPNAISFGKFSEVVKKHPDPVSNRFADSLINWQDPVPY